MAGGTWTVQNKVLPAVYINLKTAPTSLISMGERGTVAIAKQLSWGKEGEFITISSPNDCFKLLGYDQNSDEMRFIRQILLGTNRTSGANKILVWRLECNTHNHATVTVGNLTAKAKYDGTRGNDIKLVVTADPDNSEENGYSMTVQTLVDGSVVDSQTVKSESSAPTVDQLQNNDWVEFSGTGTISATVGTSLSGGTNGTLKSTSHTEFLEALERVDFNIVAYDGTDAVLKSAYATFAKRLFENEGKYVQAVMSNYKAADNKTSISVRNQKVTLDEGVELNANELIWWVAGSQAGANANESLTNSTYKGAVSVSPELTHSEQEEAIADGELAFVNSYGEIRVLYDINTLTSFTPAEGKMFSKNRSVRTVFGLANDVNRTFSRVYIGAVDNNEDGRNILKSEVLSLLYQYESIGAIQNVEADDVVVEQGTDKDAVVITIAIQLVDSAEKIYITITCS